MYVLAGAGYLAVLGRFTWATYGAYADKLLDYFLVMVPLASVLWLAFSAMLHAPRGPMAWMRGACTPQNLARYITGIALLLLLIPFLGTYTQIKGSLSAGGFGFDPAIADAEKWLHGVDAANWLALALGTGWQRVAEVNYNVGWQVYNLLFLTFVMLHPAMHGARRFYMAFYFSLWVLLGNMLAGLFISAGPAFYGVVTGDMTRFADLHALLEAGKGHAHSAWRLQQYLWKFWVEGAAGLGTGISAFPSVHIFVVTCNALFIGAYLNRWAGAVAMVYAAAVLMSSAYLGWHYLLDGYVSALLTLALFTCCLRRCRPGSGSSRWFYCREAPNRPA